MKILKNAVVLGLLVFAMSCHTNVQPANQPITDEEVVIAKGLIQGSFDDLWGGLDSTKISKYHTDDFYILEQGEVWTNEEIKDYMRRSLQRENRPVRVNMMDYINIEKHGEAISIAYNNKANFMQGDSLVGSAGWLESALAIKTENGWKLRMMHSTGLRN